MQREYHWWRLEVSPGLVRFPCERSFLECTVSWRHTLERRSGLFQPVLNFNQLLLPPGCSLKCPPIAQFIPSWPLFSPISLFLMSSIFFLSDHLLKALICCSGKGQTQEQGNRLKGHRKDDAVDHVSNDLYCHRSFQHAQRFSFHFLSLSFRPWEMS